MCSNRLGVGGFGLIVFVPECRGACVLRDLKAHARLLLLVHSFRVMPLSARADVTQHLSSFFPNKRVCLRAKQGGAGCEMRFFLLSDR